jgi:diaminopimelate epimerase
MTVPFWKLEAIGNDFVVVEGGVIPESAYADFAQFACQRRWRIGSDGLLVVSPFEDGLLMRMFNPDGSEDFCGNGLRCSARFGEAQGWVGGSFVQWHGGIAIETELQGRLVRTTLGVPTYEPAKVPHCGASALVDAVIGDVIGSAISTGSTHLVIPVQEPISEADFQRLGPMLECDPLFPERTSVIWARPMSLEELEIRIWERGVGETLGCGTGASAAAVDDMRRRGGSSRIVHSRGGQVTIDWNGPGERVAITGEAKVVFAGSVDYSPPI